MLPYPCVYLHVVSTRPMALACENLMREPYHSAHLGSKASGFTLAPNMPPKKRSIADDPLVKRQKVLEQASQSTLSLTSLQEMHDLEGRLKRDVEKYLDIKTPYGDLLVRVPIPQKIGPPYEWLVVNPFALVYAKCKRSEKWANFVYSCFRQESADTVTGHLALYTDETRPGNQRRPDMVRDTQCVYYTFLQFPAWYRNRRHGWLIFGYLEIGIQKEIPGGLTVLSKTIFNYFYNPHRFNMAIGLQVHLGQKEERFKMKVLFGCWIQDGKACQLANSIKGAYINNDKNQLYIQIHWRTLRKHFSNHKCPCWYQDSTKWMHRYRCFHIYTVGHMCVHACKTLESYENNSWG